MLHRLLLSVGLVLAFSLQHTPLRLTARARRFRFRFTPNGSVFTTAPSRL
jgi:hypothetical protein